MFILLLRWFWEYGLEILIGGFLDEGFYSVIDSSGRRLTVTLRSSPGYCPGVQGIFVPGLEYEYGVVWLLL